MLSLGFTNSQSDNSLFVSTASSQRIYVLVYVNDIVITNTSTSYVTQFIQTLTARFSLKDFGPLSYFLGIKVQATSNDLFLSKKKYIFDLLRRTHMLDAKPLSTPLSVTESLKLDDGSPPADAT